MKETINFKKQKKIPLSYFPVPRSRSVRSYLVGSLIISICLVILWMLRLGDMQSKSLRVSIGTTAKSTTKSHDRFVYALNVFDHRIAISLNKCLTIYDCLCRR